MSPPADTLRPYIADLLGRSADVDGARVFALRRGLPYEGPAQQVHDGHYVELRWCPSELAVREALLGDPPPRPLVLLTPVERLAGDVLARLRPFHELLRPRPAEALRHLFGVTMLDPAIPSWMMSALVAAAPPGGYERTGARALDLDRAWQALLRHAHRIDLDQGMGALIDWAGSEQAAGLRTLEPPERRDATAEWLAREMPGARLLLAALDAGHGDEALALGLVLRALLDGPDGAERTQARTRLEPLLGGLPFDERDARAWAEAAEARLRDLEAAGDHAAAACRQEAERRLERLGGQALAGASAQLRSGLRARLRELAVALERGEALESTKEWVAAHALAERSGATQVASLAVRLSRWLQQPCPAPGDLASAAHAYVESSSYADLARTTLRHGGGEPALEAALRGLIARADQRRAQEELQFAGLLGAWSAHARTSAELLGVEDLLAELVAPLARQRPVLVIVLDGMSHRVACELIEDAIASGFAELRRASQPRRTLAIATLPSVTTYSRASLFAGRLTTGLAADEVEAFAAHPALAAATGKSGPPLLFHKSALRNPRAGLAAEVRAEIASERRIVGAVVNAIDDHLARSDQTANPWSVRDVLPLRWLLDAARESDRIAVLLSDHGHVLDRGGVQRQHGGQGGERWRQATSPPEADELLVEGPRVLAGEGRCVLAADELLRYSPRKHGYHGGASAQEMLVPAIVLSPSPPDGLEGFLEAPYDPPAWWTGVQRQVTPSGAAEAAPSKPSPPLVGSERAGQLAFEVGLASASAGAGEPVLSAPPWIAELLGSEQLAEQRQMAARTPLPDERIASILTALADHGGKLLRPALAQACGLAPARVGGTLAALALLLNVDGYPVLNVEESSDTVELNIALLREQFGLTR